MNIIHLLYMDNIYNNINKLYTKLGFLERYGKDVLITMLIFIVFFIIFSYFLVMNNIQPIKANWTKERCNPVVMPFAGIINAPPDSNKFQYTADNFNGCLNTILTNTSAYSFSPIYYILNVFTTLFKLLVETLNTVRQMFDKMRNSMETVGDDLYSRSANITTPIIQLLINIKDMLSKTNGVLAAGLFSLFGGYFTLKSSIGAVIEITTSIMIALVAFVIFLWIIPFTWGVAAVLTPLVGTVIGLLAYTVIKSKKILNISPSRGVPGKPRCFDENTIITLYDSRIKYIKELNIGDRLLDGSTIMGIMKSSTDNHTFYKLNGVIVTGTHRVYHDQYGWILVKNHPNSILINYNKAFMYCVGTNSKLFTINDIVFGDWDELDNKDIIELYKNARHVLPEYFMREHIHQYLDGGFVKGTEIELINGKKINIEDIEVNDILKHGEKVLTTVKLDFKELSGVYEYRIQDKIIKGGPNLEIMDENLGTIDTTKLKGIIINNNNYIYNLVTDKETFYVNGIRFCDYNSTTDKYLNDRKMKNMVNTNLFLSVDYV